MRAQAVIGVQRRTGALKGASEVVQLAGSVGKQALALARGGVGFAFGFVFGAPEAFALRNRQGTKAHIVQRLQIGDGGEHVLRDALCFVLRGGLCQRGGRVVLRVQTVIGQLRDFVAQRSQPRFFPDGTKTVRGVKGFDFIGAHLPVFQRKKRRQGFQLFYKQLIFSRKRASGGHRQ
ncbi:MAG: hypothetical protein IIT59_00030 [Rhodocyclaceae bacterium]|nr:hypothetical protein [Rhodocyclaceae bacterium]